MILVSNNDPVRTRRKYNGHHVTDEDWKLSIIVLGQLSML